MYYKKLPTVYVATKKNDEINTSIKNEYKDTFKESRFATIGYSTKPYYENGYLTKPYYDL